MIKLLKEISDEDIGLARKKVAYFKRVAARAILFDDSFNIALLFVSRLNFHKIPGGRVENNENIEDGLKREILEAISLIESDQSDDYAGKFILLRQNTPCFLKLGMTCPSKLVERSWIQWPLGR